MVSNLLLLQLFFLFLPYALTKSKYEKFQFINGTFPKDFIWATATASYQIEGGWNVDGKGPSLWDYICHMKPNPVKNGDTGDVACDSYHKWKDDVKIMKDLHITHYRFSISWSRVLPTGFVKDGINPKGVAYYNNLIDLLLQNNIIPIVTMYHWDLPLGMVKAGSWINPDIINWFVDYARVLFELYGEKVKYWITFNEPYSFALGPYNGKYGSPDCEGTCPYIASSYVIKAHAQVWRMYDREYRSKQNGKVGITLSSNYNMPGSERSEDVSAAERKMQFQLGIFANPIFGNGDWPNVVKEFVANRSREQGFNHTRLALYKDFEKYYINGSYDFFGLNVYTASLAYNHYEYTDKKNASFYNDAQIFVNQSSEWHSSGSDWLKYTPFAPRGVLNWIKDHYGNVPVIITENGWSDDDGRIQDTWRVKFFQEYINSVLQAYKLDGCNVKGYTAWSLMDNFEWIAGYTQKFGIHYVNFSDPNRKRIPKNSAATYRKIVLNNGFPPQKQGTKWGSDRNVILKAFDFLKSVVSSTSTFSPANYPW